MMKEDSSVSNTTQEMVNATWDRINCTIDDACDEQLVQMVTPPDICVGGAESNDNSFGTNNNNVGANINTVGASNSNNGNSNIGANKNNNNKNAGLRRKRETRRREGGIVGSQTQEPTSGPGAPVQELHATPNADANAYAKFLIKYMDLDQDTRERIGHQVMFDC